MKQQIIDGTLDIVRQIAMGQNIEDVDITGALCAASDLILSVLPNDAVTTEDKAQQLWWDTVAAFYNTDCNDEAIGNGGRGDMGMADEALIRAGVSATVIKIYAVAVCEQAELEMHNYRLLRSVGLV